MQSTLNDFMCLRIAFMCTRMFWANDVQRKAPRAAQPKEWYKEKLNGNNMPIKKYFSERLNVCTYVFGGWLAGWLAGKRKKN